MSPLGKFVPSLGVIPKWYGLAYRTWEHDGCMVYPVPLHWLVRWYRIVVRWFKFPSVASWEQHLAQVHQRGKQIGERHAYTECEQKMREVLAGMRLPQTGQRVLTDAEVEMWVPALMPERWKAIKAQIVNETDGERRG